ncbi:ATP-binding protein [Amedibacillus sp. YH-ame10]
MEKVTFAYELDEVAKNNKEKKVQQLMENPYVQAWIKKYHKDRDFVYQHSGKFSDYCDVMEKCENCKGLDFCRQPLKGQRLLLHLDGFLMNTLCTCKYAMKEETRTLHRQYFCEKDIADMYFDIDIAHMDLSNESKEYRGMYNKVIDLFEKDHTKGIYFSGKPGAGKTYLAAGVANKFAKDKKRVAFVNVPKLIADLKMMFHDHEGMEAKLNRIKKADILILDDIGGESVTAWSRDDILLPLLDARMEQKKMTIFTSNYSMEELKQRLAMTNNKVSEPVAAERLYERMKTLSDEIFVKGESRRK